MKVSLQLIAEQPAEELLAAAQAADKLGYYACYSADEIYHKDAWLLLVAATRRTERIRLDPCVAPVYVRDPTHVAQLASIKPGGGSVWPFSPARRRAARRVRRSGLRVRGRSTGGTCSRSRRSPRPFPSRPLGRGRRRHARRRP